MDYLDIFDPNKKVLKTVLPCPRSLRRNIQDNIDVQSIASTKAKSIGTDYVAEYVEKEEEELLKSAHNVFSMGNNSNKYDEVSEGTVPSLQDIDSAKLIKIYKTFNFDYRPKINLTISSMREKIVSMVETNSVVVIQGPTGCGKTTQVPQFILDSCYKKRAHCNIIVTQPRRLAAISIAKRVCQERDWVLGTLVGFQVGMINNTSEDTRLTYCTTGVLLHKLINTKHMLDYTHIILDEVHERDQDMDFLLLVVRKFLRTNSRTVKVVLMSATFDVEKFAKYFSSPLQNKLVPAPVIDVAKRNFFNVNIFYLCQIHTLGSIPEVCPDNPKISNKMYDFCVRIVIVLDDLDKQIADNTCDLESTTNERHVILIFLPGIHEIEELYNLLSSPKYASSKWDIVVLHSSITNDQQQRIFIQPPQGYRRIILSTNIAESSITVPDVKYVIDFCLTKQLMTNPATNFQSLQLAWTSKASCDQRAGRTGRVMDGRVYRLVPKRFFENILPAESSPEMLRSPLENVVLQAKMLDMGEPKAILALSLDPPDLENLERTILLLKEAGALLNKPNDIQPFDGELTDLGRIMSQLPLDIHISKLIVLGHVFSVLKDAIIIGASMAVKDMFSNPFRQKFLAYNVKLTWADGSCSDCIAFLNVFKVWQNEKATRRLNNNVLEKNWAQRNFIQIKVLREVEAMVIDIIRRLERLGIKETVGINKVVWNDIERPFVLKVVIAGAFYPNYFVRRLVKGEDTTREETERNSIKLIGGLDPTTTVYLQGWPLNQPGPLYGRRFQEIFKDCCNIPVERIKVFFEASSRVFIQFQKNETSEMNSSGANKKIPLAVYKAVKMRLCNVVRKVPILNEGVALERAQELNLVQKTSDVFFNGNLHKKKRMSEPWEKPVLPGLDMSYIHIRVMHIFNPSHFFAQNADQETRDTLQRMQDLCNIEKDASISFDSHPEIGTLVLAPLKRNDQIKYCRARVEDSIQGYNDIIVIVFFIDYGSKKQVTLRDVRPVADESKIRKVAALAFECVLANVQPSVTHNLNEEWSAASFEMFTQLVYSRNKLYGKIYSIVNNVVALRLITESKNGEHVCINDHLIENGVAARKEENFLSRRNHEIREKGDEMTTEQRRRYEELQYDQSFAADHYPDPPSVRECTSEVQLRGPYSPLEIDLLNLTQAGKGKKVHIDMNSVNSVLLDPSFEDPFERLLVAAAINQSITNTNLSLRHTTLMPNLPGLTALLSLIFTPCIELRRNNFATRYVGALCGLGYDPRTKQSIFPEHDMEIQFDVEITMDDLQDINRLRHWMNIGMQIDKDHQDEENNDAVIICQNKVKEMLFKIVEKLRTVQKSELIDGFQKWSLYDDTLFLSPGRVSMVKNNVYNLHNALELEEKNEELEKMVEHLLELRSLAIEDTRKSLDSDIHCKLCNVQMSSIPSLRSHLYTVAHRQRVKALDINVEG